MRIKEGCEICQHTQSRNDNDHYCRLYKDIPEATCQHFVDRRQSENLSRYELVFEPDQTE